MKVITSAIDVGSVCILDAFVLIRLVRFSVACELRQFRFLFGGAIVFNHDAVSLFYGKQFGCLSCSSQRRAGSIWFYPWKRNAVSLRADPVCSKFEIGTSSALFVLVVIAWNNSEWVFDQWHCTSLFGTMLTLVAIESRYVTALKVGMLLHWKLVCYRTSWSRSHPKSVTPKRRYGTALKVSMLPHWKSVCYRIESWYVTAQVDLWLQFQAGHPQKSICDRIESRSVTAF